MNDDQTPPPVVKSYAAGIAARTAAQQEQRKQNPVFPNLGQAAVTFDPSSQQTLADVGRAQRADAPVPEKRPLSPETVEGLKALKTAQDQQLKDKSAAEAAVGPVAAPKKPEVVEPEDEEDLAFAEALRTVQKDVIQNDREREAVAKRVEEIDLAEGLLTGEFTQLVPIVPDKLTVRFRCLTPVENNEIRLYVYDEIQADSRKDRIAAELVALYQTVASVVSINGTDYHRHMVADGPMGNLTFQKQIFEGKIRRFMSFPLPLISSLGTHSAWFEQRVRLLFSTTERLKNG